MLSIQEQDYINKTVKRNHYLEKEVIRYKLLVKHYQDLTLIKQGITPKRWMSNKNF